MGGRKDCCSARIGTSFDAKKWLSLDPCGLVGVTCSFSVHAFAYVTNALHLIEGSMFATAIFLLVYTPMTCFALSSLYMAWITDPGAVPMGARPLVTVKRAASGEMEATNSRSRATRRCHKCNDNFKPPRAHHDSVTGRCVVKFDHFCPWVGNAVGALNHKFFVLFVGYTLASCIVTLFMMILRAIHCSYTKDSDDTAGGNVQGSDLNSNSAPAAEEDPSRFLSREEECSGWFESYSVLALLVVSVIFMVFTCCMLFEQIEAIETNSSKIARMKMRVGQAGTELSRVTEEFNEMFGGTTKNVALHWFLPVPVEFPRGMRKAVLGYEWDATFDPVPYEEPGSHGSRDEEQGGGGGGNGKIELTPVVTTSALSSSPPVATEVPPSRIIAAKSNEGEEASFVGTPVVAEARTLTKRSNSRGPDGRPRSSQGTLT